MIAQTSFTIDSETEALPTGFLQVRDFYILNGNTKSPLLIQLHHKWIAQLEHLQLVCQTHLQF